MSTYSPYFDSTSYFNYGVPAGYRCTNTSGSEITGIKVKQADYTQLEEVQVWSDMQNDSSPLATKSTSGTFDGSDTTVITGFSIPDGEQFDIVGTDGSDGKIHEDDTSYPISTGDFTVESGIVDGDIRTSERYTFDYVEAPYAPPPTAPASATATVDANDKITVSYDAGSNADNYRIEMSRDGASYVEPAGGDATPSSGTTSVSFGPNSDYAYDKQVGIDSSFKFRVRAENSGGNSDWTYTSTVYTDPLPPHNPSVNRPDANTAEINWNNQ